MDLGAGLFMRPEREPERRRQMGFGLAGLRPRFPRHVEQLVLLDDVKIQCGARDSVGPGRGAADGLGPDAADQQRRATGLHRLWADRQDRIGQLFAGPHPLHQRHALGHTVHRLGF